jgi:hypothetical protein
MSFKVRCTQCGKASVFSASDAGMTALCIACGARFVIPADAAKTAEGVIPDRELVDAAPGEPLDDFIPAQPVASGSEAPAAAAEASPSAPIPPTLTEPKARRGPNYGLLYALLGSAVTAALILLAVFILGSRPTWEDHNRVALRDLKSQAEAYAIDGKLQRAYDTYRKIDERLAGHEVEDSQLKAELTKAHADRDQVFKLLMAKKERRPASGATTMASVGSSKAIEVTIPPEIEAPTSRPATAPVVVERDWPEYHGKRLMAWAAGQPQVTQTATRPAPRMEQSPATRSVTPPVTVAHHAAPGTPRRWPEIVVQRRGREAATGLTDEQIGQAISRGVNYLIAQFDNGELHGGQIRNDTYHTGLNALCVYALLQSSLAIKDERLNLKGPFVRELVQKMKAMRVGNGPVTYALGIRATALALLARPEDKQALTRDVMYLLNSQNAGAYTYQALPRGGSPGRMGDRWDNSNSQYGLLGVWSAAEIGAEVNSTYWAAVENHWTRCQLDDGSWDYSGRGHGGTGRISMSVAGVASLFVTHDYLDAPRIGAQVGREPFSKALAKGLAYLERGDNSVDLNGGYTLYGLERAGLASGFKYFGTHDWYRELAAVVIRNQGPDGSWGGEIETAYHLLFLARGRHPILMNKLRYDGYWANRPRDVANLARFGSRELERPLNWQVVPITRDWTDWTDSPILYIASHKSVKLSDDEVDKIRNFVDAGGLLFTQADGNAVEADQWARALAKKLFPLYEMKDLPDDHPIYNILYKPSPHPKLRAVSNGARLMMVHSPTDITQYWQMRQDKSRRSLFELGMNLYLYASGKSDLRNRIASTFIPPQGAAGGGSVSMVRVKYAGNWDPEPVAWGRFGRYFQRETDVALNVSAVDMDRLDPKLAPVAHWTGTDAYTPTQAQLDALRRFVEGGGVLVVDPCGGSGEFYESARQALAKAFPDSRGEMMSRDHPMLTASGPGMDDLSKPLVRSYVKSKGFGTSGRLDSFRFGKGAVIYNPLDIESGLLGTNTWGILGFEPAYASSLMKNIVLWSVSGMKSE